MDHQEKRAELITYFRDKLRDQTMVAREADESQQELAELQMQKTSFSLILLEDGQTELNGEKVDLTDAKIDLMYKNYIEQPLF